MELNPKTKYEDLMSYNKDLIATEKAAKYANSILGKIESEVNKEKILEILFNENEKLKESYKGKIFIEDKLPFDSLNHLESFLLETELFEESEIKDSIKRSYETIERCLVRDFNKINVQCWFVIKDKSIVYVPHFSVSLNKDQTIDCVFNELRDELIN
jgi:hypothetical protein